MINRRITFSFVVILTIIFICNLDCSNKKKILFRDENLLRDTINLFKYSDSLKIEIELNDSIFYVNALCEMELSITLKNESHQDIMVPFKEVKVWPCSCPWNTFYSIILGSYDEGRSIKIEPNIRCRDFDFSFLNKGSFKLLKASEQIESIKITDLIRCYGVNNVTDKNILNYWLVVLFSNYTWDKSDYPIWMGQNKSDTLRFKLVKTNK